MARAARVAQYQINFFSHFWNHNKLKQLLRVQRIKNSDIFLLVDPLILSNWHKYKKYKEHEKLPR